MLDIGLKFYLAPSPNLLSAHWGHSDKGVVYRLSYEGLNGVY